MSIRTCLINPPPFYKNLPSFPIGLATIAATVCARGHDAQVLDMTFPKWSLESVARYISKHSPRLVGIASVYTCTAAKTLGLIRDIRRMFPDLQIVVGGTHASYCYADYLDGTGANAVVRFEGEQTTADLCDVLDRNGEMSGVPGLCLANGSAVLTTAARAPVANLDDIPFPAYRLFDIASYVLPRGSNAGANPFPIIMSRGCPYSCIYCSSGAFWGPRVRWRSASNIMAEMDFLYSNYGIEYFDFQDDTWTLNHNRIEPILSMLKQRPYRWACETRADRTGKDLLASLREAGCAYIRFGFESANQDTLDLLERKIRYEKMVEFIQHAADVGIRVRPSIMIGIPGETRNDVERTIEQLKALPLTGPVAAWAFTPIPGTKAYEKGDEYGMKLHSRDFSEFTPHASIISTAELAREDINLLLIRTQMELGLLRNADAQPPSFLGCDIEIWPVDGASRLNRAKGHLRALATEDGQVTLAPSAKDLQWGDRLIVANRGSFFELDIEAARIWLLLDRSMHFDELVRSFADQVAAQYPEAETRVRPIINKMLIAELLDIEQDEVRSKNRQRQLLTGDVWGGRKDEVVRYLGEMS